MFFKVFKLAPLSMITYPFYLLLSWIATLLAFILSPLIAAISVITGKNQVSGFLSYFYTHDASLDGGIEQGKDGYDPNAKGVKLWWQRVSWICRNPAYKFVAHVLGFKDEGSELIFEHGEAWPNSDYWTVVRSPRGYNYFGYRGKKCWFGWNYMSYGGYHQVKSKPYKFSD